MTTRLCPGLHPLAHGTYAWLAPHGTWGRSNAGLITDQGQSMLVDTLYDLQLTGEMLGKMRRAEPAAEFIDILVNTHADGSHCNGNELAIGAEIISSAAAALEMHDVTPDAMAAVMATTAELGELGAYFKHCFGHYQFEGIQLTLPTRTFEGELELRVGDKQVKLLEVGPAHSRGDIIVYCPDDKVVFTGDVVCIENTPLMWQGPVANWLAACKLIEDLDVDYIVPGHGPITDRHGVVKVRQYLQYIRDQARSRYDAGMSAFEAAKDIELGEYATWTDAERIAVSVDSLYWEFSGQQSRTDLVELMTRMGVMAGLIGDY